MLCCMFQPLSYECPVRTDYGIEDTSLTAPGPSSGQPNSSFSEFPAGEPLGEPSGADTPTFYALRHRWYNPKTSTSQAETQTDHPFHI